MLVTLRGERVNEDLDNSRLWLQANKLSLKVAQAEYMLICSRQRLAKLSLEPNVTIGRDPIKSQINLNTWCLH